MKKTTYSNATLNVVLQQTESITTDSCPIGIISRNPEGQFLFEESARRCRCEQRNPIRFDGPYLSLTRKKDGRYSFNMKPVTCNDKLNFKTFSEGVRKDIKQAFEHIQAVQ